ncbi:hypothetical protein BZG36_04088 [Bifiguratus adelaidae]|uniref:Uncharacterized protein n=1 Tax=Bifiguratus adelaidae TaxID=1938954 RepID=A0A261XWW9_9FUNG|nr:hypothetical protein BZG36_04088 [Bifiguratus adelaidae]
MLSKLVSLCIAICIQLLFVSQVNAQWGFGMNTMRNNADQNFNNMAVQNSDSLAFNLQKQSNDAAVMSNNKANTGNSLTQFHKRGVYGAYTGPYGSPYGTFGGVGTLGYNALVTFQSLLAIKAVSGMFLKRQSPTDASIAADTVSGDGGAPGITDYAAMYGGVAGNPWDSGLYQYGPPPYGSYGGSGYPAYTFANSANQADAGSIAKQQSNSLAANIQATKNDAFALNNNGASTGAWGTNFKKRQYGAGPFMVPPYGFGYGSGYGYPSSFTTGQNQNAGMGQIASQHQSTLGANINQSDNNAYYKSNSNQNQGNSQTAGSNLVVMEEFIRRVQNENSILANCAYIKDYTQRHVLNSNENARNFYICLPSLCKEIFGSEDRPGWLHRNLTPQEERTISDVFGPCGVVIQALIKLHHEPGFKYEITAERLPAKIRDSLTSSTLYQLPSYYRQRTVIPSNSNNIAGYRMASSVASSTSPSSNTTSGVANPRPTLCLSMIEFWLYYFVYALTIKHSVSNNGRADSQSSSLSGRFAPVTGLAKGNLSYGSSQLFPGMSSKLPGQPMSTARTFSRQLSSSLYIDFLYEYLTYFVPIGQGQSSGEQSAARATVPTTASPRPHSQLLSQARSAVHTLQNIPSPSKQAVKGGLLQIGEQVLEHSPARGLRQTPTKATASTPQAPRHRVPPNGILEDSHVDMLQQRSEAAASLAEFFFGTIIEIWVSQVQASPGSPPSNRASDPLWPDGQSMIGDQRQSTTSDRLAAVKPISKSDAKPSGEVLYGIQCAVQYVAMSDCRNCLSDRTAGGTDAAAVKHRLQRFAYVNMQSRLYWFLKWTMINYPMIDSFESMVTIWSRWAFPWQTLGNNDNVSGWTSYILDNAVFYLVNCHWLLERAAIFGFVDIDSRKAGLTVSSASGVTTGTFASDVKMLLSISDTFQNQDLKDILSEIERALAAPASYLAMSKNSTTPLGRKFSSAGLTKRPSYASSGIPRQSSSSSITSVSNDPRRQLQQEVANSLSVLRASSTNLEGSRWSPDGLFAQGEEGKTLVQNVLQNLQRAIRIRQSLLIELLNPTKGDAGFWSKVAAFFEQTQNEDDLGNKRKLERQIKDLQMCTERFGRAYNATPEQIKTVVDSQPLDLRNAQLSQLTAQQSLYVRYDSEADKKGYLTDEARTQIRLGLRKCSKDDIPTVGPRASKVVRTYEFEPIVRITEYLENWQRSNQGFIVPLRWLANKLLFTCLCGFLLIIFANRYFLSSPQVYSAPVGGTSHMSVRHRRPVPPRSQHPTVRVGRHHQATYRHARDDAWMDVRDGQGIDEPLTSKVDSTGTVEPVQVHRDVIEPTGAGVQINERADAYKGIPPPALNEKTNLSNDVESSYADLNEEVQVKSPESKPVAQQASEAAAGAAVETKRGVSDMYNEAKTAAVEAKDAAYEVAAEAKKAVTEEQTQAKTVWETASKEVSTDLQEAKGAALDTYEAMKETAGFMKDGLAVAATEVLKAVNSISSSLTESTQGLINNLEDGREQRVKETVTKMKTDFEPQAGEPVIVNAAVPPATVFPNKVK